MLTFCSQSAYMLQNDFNGYMGEKTLYEKKALSLHH